MKTFVMLSLLVAAPAFAEEQPIATAPPPKTLGVDAIAIVPVGDYADVATFGAGPAVRLEVPVGDGFVTARLGALFHALRDDIDLGGTSLTMLPAYVGYRWSLGGSGYLAGEAGITFLHAAVDTPYGSMSDTDSELGLAVMAGVRRGALDLRAGLFVPDIADAVGLTASAGYDFAAF